MHRLCSLLILLAYESPVSGDGTDILDAARQSVAAQLARVARYACVQTIDRQYFASEEKLPEGCTRQPLSFPSRPSMSDRLRLDVAVSEGSEIYSWHGESKFSASDVSSVVRTGPISSGNFVGFLQNIFATPGPEFTFAGEGEQNGVKTYNFSYTVALAHSACRIQAKGGRITVPFHGSFTISASDYQLVSLEVLVDEVPADSAVCSAKTNITYQLVPISGQPSLIPATFVLHIEDNEHVRTVSSSQYSQCREFRGESTVHFDFADASSPSPARQSTADHWLPAGLSLHVGLRTPVDDRTAYIGDPVRGVLLHGIKIPGTGKSIPRGAVLEGVITKLETHFQPLLFQLFSVQFTRLTFGSTSFLLNARPKTSRHDRILLRDVYGSPSPAFVVEECERGLFVGSLAHLELDNSFSAEWITSGPPAVDVP